ncbi:TonB-dependent receptor [soil metagenome]
MNRLLITGFFMLFSAYFSVLVAQEKSVTGTITSLEDGAALPGVNIIVQGTSTGTVSDVDGNYRINVSPGEVLVFSFIGFISQELTVGAPNVYIIQLSPDVQQLSEVIVTGYVVQEKREITGSIASVSSADFQDIPVVGVDQALQGLAAGVQVTQSSGTPGGGIQVRVRGNTSISASNRPLFIIDGVPVEDGALALRSFGGQNDNALSTINPNDIENIQVLKDASAKAIYGSRAANGVVLVTTKRGRMDSRTNINMEVQRGIIDPTNKIRLLNSGQLLELQREAYINAGQNPDEQGLIPGVNDAVNTNWLDEIFRRGILQQYQLSARGGSEKTSFYISGAYRDEEGVQLNNKFERYTGMINLDHKATTRLSFGSNLTLSRTHNHRVKGDNFLDGVYSGAVKSLPFYYPYDELGNIIGPGSAAYAAFPNFNPVGQAVLPRFITYTTKILGGVFAEYELLEGLRFRTKFSADYNGVSEDQFEPSSTAIGGFLESVGGRGYGVYSTGAYATIINTNTLTFSKTLRDRHNILGVAGTEFLQRTERTSSVQGRLFPSDDFTYITSAGIVDAGSSYMVQNGLVSYFIQANYDFRKKYFLTLNTRLDGSSRFGAGRRYGLFPAISGGWSIASEPFMENMTFIDDLKLRASYGVTGNERIGDFTFLGTWAASTYSGVSGTAPAGLSNPNLQWERTTEGTVGVDLSFFNGRLQANFDAYSNITNDLLFAQPIPATTGFGSFQGNIGTISNKGLELALTTVNVNRRVNWSTTINVSRNINKVVSLADTLPLFRGYQASGISNTNVVLPGHPLGTFWGLRFLGVDPATGDAIYDDINEDGEITPDDATVIGNAQPLFLGGITNRFSFGGFDLNIFFQFSYGNKMLNFSNTALLDAGEDLSNNQVVAALDRWRQPGDITSVPRYEAGNTVNNWHSSRFLEDGSFLRLKNISLGYSIPNNYLGKVKIYSARVFASATNLLTFTNYTGGDPEVSTLDGSTTAQGIDFFTLPQVRTMMVGINVTF